MSRRRAQNSHDLGEDEWEDVSSESGNELDSEPLDASKPPSNPSGPRSSFRQVPISPRKRKQRHTPARAPPPPPPSTHTVKRRKGHIELPTDEWIEAAMHAIRLTLTYLVDVFGGGVSLLRRPLSVLLFLWLLSLLIGRISTTLKSTFAPLCIIPGISSISLCHPDSLYSHSGKTPNSRNGSPKWADYPKLMDAQSKTFEQLLDSSVGGSGLSLDIKKAEMATSDLVTLVRYSKLTSRDFIAEALSAFVDEARRTGRGLQRLGSKVGGAVDQILAVNDHALHSIEAAQSNPSLLSFRSLVPFYSASTNRIILQSFTEAMEVLSGTIERLIVEAEVQLANLEKLEEGLTLLHDVISREDSTISSAKSDLLSDLWTKLGGNRRQLMGYDERLALLRGLGEYRKQALVHVVSALQTLRALSDDMEDLRERVTEPQLAEHISVEVHMKSIAFGLQRLKESRVHAREREEEAVRRILGAEHFEALDVSARKRSY